MECSKGILEHLQLFWKAPRMFGRCSESFQEPLPYFTMSCPAGMLQYSQPSIDVLVNGIEKICCALENTSAKSPWRFLSCPESPMKDAIQRHEEDLLSSMWVTGYLSLYACESKFFQLRVPHLKMQKLELIFEVQVFQYLWDVPHTVWCEISVSRMYLQMIREIQFNCIPSN